MALLSLYNYYLTSKGRYTDFGILQQILSIEYFIYFVYWILGSEFFEVFFVLDFKEANFKQPIAQIGGI